VPKGDGVAGVAKNGEMSQYKKEVSISLFSPLPHLKVPITLGGRQGGGGNGRRKKTVWLPSASTY